MNLYAKLCERAAQDRPLQVGALPLGLAHGWKLTQPVAAGELVRWADIVVDEANSAVRVRREMEKRFRVKYGEDEGPKVEC